MKVKHVSASMQVAGAAVLAATLVLTGCGGGGSGSANEGTSLYDGFGPGNPSSCPRAQLDDIWYARRLGCLAVGQRFVQASSAGGDVADRAYVFGQQVLDASLTNVLGSGKLRFVKYALCVKNAPATVSGGTLGGDLGVAMGLNTLATGNTFYPPGVSGSYFAYGGVVDANTLVTPCDPARHPVIVDFATGRVTSVNPAAIAQVQVFDQ